MAEKYEDNNRVVPLSETDEAICASFIEDNEWLRRVIRLSPCGNPTSELLRKLWSYAVKRNRKIDLANALLGRDMGLLSGAGRDFFIECILPHDAPDFFWLTFRYGWVRRKLALGTFDQEEDAECAIGSTEMLMEEAGGDGIVDMKDVLRKLRLKLNAEIRAAEEEWKNRGLAEE